MAIEKTLNTRIKLRYDLYSNWSTNNPVLLAGEVALAYIPTDNTLNVGQDVTGTTPPQVLIKVGDGTNHYNDLKYVSALAADVLTACKSEDGLKAFINGVIAEAGIATNEAMETLAGRVTTAEGKITTLEGNITTLNGEATVEGSVAKKIADAIAALDLANTYEAKGEAAKVQTALNTYKEANDIALANVKATAEAAYVKPVTGIAKDDLSAEVKASLGKADTALQEHQDISNLATKTELTTGLAGKVDNNTYTTKVGELETAIGGKVDKVEGKSLIDDSEIARLANVTNYDDTQVKADIAKKADAATMTTELGKKVDKVTGYSLVSDTEIARLAGVTNYDDTAVKADITKKADAETVNTELGKKVDKVEGYSLVADDEITRLADVDNYDDTEVRGLIGDNTDAIDALANKVGTVPEGQSVMGIIQNIQENAYDDTELVNRITAIEDDYLTSADKYDDTAIVERVTTAEGEIDELQSKVEGLNGAMHFKGVYDEMPNVISPIKEGDPVAYGDTIYVDTTKVAPFLESYFATNPESDGVYTGSDYIYELVNIYNGSYGAREIFVTKNEVLNDWTLYGDGHQIHSEKFPSEEPVVSLQVGVNAQYFEKVVDGLDFVYLTDPTTGETFEPGDVIVVGEKEYVYNGTEFVEFGSAQDWLLKSEASTTYETKTDATAKLTEAKGHADGLNTAMDSRVKALEAIDHNAYIAADEEVLADAKEYADGLNTAMDTRVQAVEKKATDNTNAIATHNQQYEDLVGRTETIETFIGGSLGNTSLDMVVNTAVSGKADKSEVTTVANNLADVKATADTAVQTVTADTGLKATKTGTDVAISFDEAVTFIFDCGDSNI